MPKVKTQAAKRSLLRNVRRQRLNLITPLPSLITLINGLCGFTAIVFAARGSDILLGGFSAFAIACYMILIAMIADSLDGRIARISHNTTSFGGQLDSLCDIVSFGVAPAFVMLMLIKHQLEHLSLNQSLENYMSKFFWLAAAAYVCCTAIRLARFNVENEEDESAHMSFTGLPTPAAAGTIVSLVILHQETLPELADKHTMVYSVMDNGLIFTLPFVVIGIAVLMVSRIRYPHVINQYMKGKKPFAYLLISLAVVFLVIWFRQPALVIGFCGFSFSGFSTWLYKLIARSKQTSAICQENQLNPASATDS